MERISGRKRSGQSDILAHYDIVARKDSPTGDAIRSALFVLDHAEATPEQMITSANRIYADHRKRKALGVLATADGVERLRRVIGVLSGSKPGVVEGKHVPVEVSTTLTQVLHWLEVQRLETIRRKRNPNSVQHQ